MTEKLYDEYPRMSEFTAEVLSSDGCEAILDKTAFFPESGGQPADEGTLGGAAVLGVFLRGEEIVHLTDRPIACGRVQGKINFEKRFRRMQNHTGEHILSGIAHRMYGCENVGFHLADGEMTLDFDKELSSDQLYTLETEANETLYRCIPIKTEYPDAERLAKLEYRSKLELSGRVRIVTIEGVDVCACCAPHVSNTGEIGIIKILGSERWKGGVRLSALCGRDALEDCRARLSALSAAAASLSVKPQEINAGLERLRSELAERKRSESAFRRAYISLRAEQTPPCDGCELLFEENLDMPSACELASTLAGRCRIAAVISGEQYAIASEKEDMRSLSKALNAALNGRGGGRAALASGRIQASPSEIKKFFEK